MALGFAVVLRGEGNGRDGAGAGARSRSFAVEGSRRIYEGYSGLSSVAQDEGDSESLVAERTGAWMVGACSGRVVAGYRVGGSRRMVGH